MDKTVGVLGGGQLGRMLVEAANLMGIRVNFLDAPNSSAKQVSNHDGHIDGSFKDANAIRKLAAVSDVLTIEIEHVDTRILEEIAGEGAVVQPHWKTIRGIQDKFAQKETLRNAGVATAESVALAEPSISELERVGKQLGMPFMLKSRREAYDGRGNFVVKSASDFDAALQALGGNKDLYAEKWAAFTMELAVMVVKTADDVLSYPTVETVHENSICKLVYAPARGVPSAINTRAQALAKKAIASFAGKGVFGVEMFLLAPPTPTDDPVLLVNEIAPRPHNSGHYTIEACPVSQYEAHLRAILDLPLHASDLTLREPAVMLNILGGSTPDSHTLFAAEALQTRRTKLHLYGKGAARPGRKMGHVTTCAPSMAEAETLIAPLVAFADGNSTNTPLTTPTTTTTTTTTTAAQLPLVAVTMGSDSDLPHLRPCLEKLTHFAIPYTVRITSAHRTPAAMSAFASTASTTSLRVIIAAAGGAAHLPGMIASYTPLPVIGVPIKPSVGDGWDSLVSMSNMPRGVPVATVGVNNAVNAALLAVRVLGAGDEAVRERYVQWMREGEEGVRAKDRAVGVGGWEKYLEGMGK